MFESSRPQSKSPYGMKARRRRKTSKEERVCPVCAQAFKKAEHLARHVRSHTKEKPFNCPVCDKAFARQDTLLRHSRSHSQQDQSQISFNMHPLPTEGSHESGLDPRLMPMAPIQAPINTTAPSASKTGSITGDMAALMSPPNSTAIDQQTPNLSIGENPTYPTQMSPLASFLPLEAGDTWRYDQSSSPSALWEYHLDNREWETLLTGDDFDLDAVNFSLMCATSDHVPPLAADAVPDSSIRPPIPSISEPNIDIDSAKRHATMVQKKWHTFPGDAERALSGQMTPLAQLPGNSFIDENYRTRLAERLHQRVQHGILPSTPFLDLCIQAYFSKFQPLFPVVHMPTFRPGIQNSVLLLSICSAGSLLIGSPRAISHGISMFERLNKAILSTWDTYATKLAGSSLVALQASMVGQTFGLLMGRQKDLYGIEMFHGSVVAWARKGKLFDLEHPKYDLTDVEGKALEDMWLSWIQVEVKKRIVLGLFVHDAELAKIHHHEPILRHSTTRLPVLSPSELFTAPSAAQWKIIMKDTQLKSRHQDYVSPASSTQASPHGHIPSDFALCAMLQSISALSCEERDSEPISTSRNTSRCHELLITWHGTYQSRMTGKATWFCLMMLWHSIFMNLHADFNALECALGREGYDVAQEYIPYARQWIHSMNAKRCLLHAMLIQKNFESLPAGAEPAIHVPMCLYYCGLVWSCFMLFNKGPEADSVVISAADHLQFAELDLQGIDGVGAFLEQMGGLQPSRLATGSLFRIIDLLQRINHWKISQSLASTLLALVEETQDLF